MPWNNRVALPRAIGLTIILNSSINPLWARLTAKLLPPTLKSLLSLLFPAVDLFWIDFSNESNVLPILLFLDALEGFREDDLVHIIDQMRDFEIILRCCGIVLVRDMKVCERRLVRDSFVNRREKTG